MATLAVSASRNMSPTAAAANSSVSGGRHSVTAADVAADQANTSLPPRPITSGHDSPDVSYHQGASLANQWSAAQNDTAAGAVYNSSYFAGHQVAPAPAAFNQRPQRPLHDIVSSMQGSFHFLQESQIELESKYLSHGFYSTVYCPFCLKFSIFDNLDVTVIGNWQDGNDDGDDVMICVIVIH